MTFRVFDAPARFEQVRLMNQRDGKAGIIARRKEILEKFRMPVRVDDESVYSYADQMIECESNKRLLKDRNERLRKLFGQWTQARAQTGCQNECLSDFAHEKKIERFRPPRLKATAQRATSFNNDTDRLRTLPISNKASACRNR